jgi:hypothetical protein
MLVRECAQGKLGAHAFQVIDGYNVVKAIEACGSSSGSTSHDVMIQDCGEGRGPAQPATASAQASGALLKDHQSRPSVLSSSHPQQLSRLGLLATLLTRQLNPGDTS